MNIENNEHPTESRLEVFDGETLHPALDIKNRILVVGFRYRSKPQEEKEIFVVASQTGGIRLVNADSFEENGKTYYFEKRSRKLVKIEDRWSITALEKFLAEYIGLKTSVNPRQIFEEILELAQKYIELEREIDYFLLTSWVIGTYFSPVFYAYPFLHIKAPKRSGKSQCLNLLTQLCFNAVKARPSLPALGDTVDALHGTYLIDQADSLGRKGTEELLDILADSYKKSGGKRRVINFDKKRGRETLEFETYGPKAFASIRELPEDLRDRCLVVQLLRSQRNFLDPDDSNESWHDIRGKLYTLLICNFELASSHYALKKREYKLSQEIIGRSLELWLPFEVILECTGMQGKIKDAKARFLSQYGFSEYEPSELEEEVIRVIMCQLETQAELTLTPKEIAELMDEEVFAPPDNAKQRAAKVGWAIKKFNLASEKKSRTKEGMRYLFEKTRVESVYKSYCTNNADEHTPPTSASIEGEKPEETKVQVF
jgi:hypothetical protein